MNKTKIDWADMSWSPVTGCLHDCEYCYARKIANRFGLHLEADEPKVLEEKYSFETQCIMTGERDCISSPYPYDFHPTFHKYRLNEPTRKTKGQTIFVCSMADLFGEWVTDEWIEEVFKACEAAPQHRYLFLTKNPSRYNELKIPVGKNFWYGSTVNDMKSLFAHKKVDETSQCNYFISIEPIMEHLYIQHSLPFIGWVIVGAETGNRKGKATPERQWILDIKDQCKAVGTPLFMKESIRELMGEDFVQEFPW